MRRKPQVFIKKIFANVPVFDTGGRGSTTTFIERQIGDVLITFEAETRRHCQGVWPGQVRHRDAAREPHRRIPRERRRQGGRAKRLARHLAEAYSTFSIRRKAQEIIATHFNRPIDKAVAAKHASDFGEVRLVTVEDVFGGWKKVTEEHLADGGILDRLYVGQ